jgi:2-phosphoglycerate kinase
MAKTLVIDKDGTRVPFLRGILTRSLQDAGLEFEAAYSLASRVREELEHESEISAGDLRLRVSGLLEAEFDPVLSKSYQAVMRRPPQVVVRETNNVVVPFSRGLHRRRLEPCGLPRDKADEITRQVYQTVLEMRRDEISADQVYALTEQALEQQTGQPYAKRYAVWRRFLKSEQPLILLIGGAPGCGKSTLATEIASRLEIIRTQSTDMLREVMRTMISRRMVPELHRSSFEAWQDLPHHHANKRDAISRKIEGFDRQCDLLEVAVEAVFARAVREGVSLIIEGVHIRPGLVPRVLAESNAVVVQVILGVLPKKRLRQYIERRGTGLVQRRSERYLNNFDSIWELQSVLLSDADRNEIPIVVNDSKNAAIRQIMGVISDALIDNETRLDRSN